MTGEGKETRKTKPAAKGKGKGIHKTEIEKKKRQPVILR